MKLVYLSLLLISLSLVACAANPPETPRVEVKGIWHVEGQYSKLP